MAITLFGIPNCDTVKRARGWLNQQGLRHAFHDYKKAGVPAPRLDAWVGALGWEPLLNRHGSTWRNLDGAVRLAVDDAASAKALMRQHPSVIKRPVVEWDDGAVTVGFDAKAWSAHAK